MNSIKTISALLLKAGILSTEFILSLQSNNRVGFVIFTKSGMQKLNNNLSLKASLLQSQVEFI